MGYIDLGVKNVRCHRLTVKSNRFSPAQSVRASSVSCRDSYKAPPSTSLNATFSPFSTIQISEIFVSVYGTKISASTDSCTVGYNREYIDRITFLCERKGSALVRRADAGSVDIAEGFHPLAKTVQAVPGIDRDAAVWLWADVQCHVAAFGNDVDKHADKAHAEIYNDRRIRT